MSDAPSSDARAVAAATLAVAVMQTRHVADIFDGSNVEKTKAGFIKTYEWAYDAVSHFHAARASDAIDAGVAVFTGGRPAD